MQRKAALQVIRALNELPDELLLKIGYYLPSIADIAVFSLVAKRYQALLEDLFKERIRLFSELPLLSKNAHTESQTSFRDYYRKAHFYLLPPQRAALKGATSKEQQNKDYRYERLSFLIKNGVSLERIKLLDIANEDYLLIKPNCRNALELAKNAGRQDILDYFFAKKIAELTTQKKRRIDKIVAAIYCYQSPQVIEEMIQKSRVAKLRETMLFVMIKVNHMNAFLASLSTILQGRSDLTPETFLNGVFDKYKNGLLCYAILYGRDDLAEILLNFKINVNQMIEGKSLTAYFEFPTPEFSLHKATPLHLAVMRKALNMVELLIRHGAKQDTKVLHNVANIDAKWVTALDLAKMLGYVEIQECLSKAPRLTNKK